MSCIICEKHKDVCEEINRLKGAGAMNTLIFKLLVHSITTRVVASPQKSPMEFTLSDLWLHISEHSMSTEEYRGRMSGYGVPRVLFELG